MEPRDYFSVLWQYLWVILLTVAVTVGVVLFGTLKATPIYSATVTLRIATTAGGTISYSDYAYADRLLNTYIKIATSNPVLQELQQQLNLPKPPKVYAEFVPNTELIQVSVESSDPALAATASNTLAQILIAKTASLYGGEGKKPTEILQEQLDKVGAEIKQARQDYENLVAASPSDTDKITAASQSIALKERSYSTLLDQYEQARVRESIQENSVSIVEPAVTPIKPIKPNKVINIAIGVLVGLIGGMGLAFLFNHFDTTLKTTVQVEALTGLPVIGKIPNVKANISLNLSKEYSPFDEAIRRLRVNILARKNGSQMKTLLLTSTNPQEGKSLIIAKLSTVIAQTGLQVVVVDCDLHVPTIHKVFKLPNEAGLSNIFTEQVPWQKVVQKTRYHGVSVITRGPALQNPTECLGSAEMKKLLDDLENQFDMVLLDTPSLLALADAAVLAPVSDGVILIVRRGVTRKEELMIAQRQLMDLDARIIGVVENRTDENLSYNYYRGRSY